MAMVPSTATSSRNFASHRGETYSLSLKKGPGFVAYMSLYSGCLMNFPEPHGSFDFRSHEVSAFCDRRRRKKASRSPRRAYSSRASSSCCAQNNFVRFASAEKIQGEREKPRGGGGEEAGEMENEVFKQPVGLKSFCFFSEGSRPGANIRSIGINISVCWK